MTASSASFAASFTIPGRSAATNSAASASTLVTSTVDTQSRISVRPSTQPSSARRRLNGLGLASVLQPKPLRKPTRFGAAAPSWAAARPAHVASARLTTPPAISWIMSFRLIFLAPAKK